MMEEERREAIEQQINEIKEKIIEITRLIGERLDERIGSVSKRGSKPRIGRDRLFWGTALIAIGFIWLGRSLGWFFWEVPIWPVAIILIGLYLLYAGKKRG